MKCYRLLSLAALLISIQLVSTSCHGLDINGSATYVNEKDQRQVLQFSTGNDLRSWVAGLKKIPEQGEYVRWNLSAAEGHDYLKALARHPAFVAPLPWQTNTPAYPSQPGGAAYNRNNEDNGSGATLGRAFWDKLLR